MKLLIDESPLIVLPSLAKAIGLEEAIVLQQIHYQMRLRTADANEWVPISITKLLEWCPFLSRRSMERIVSSLKAQGMIEVGKRDGWDRSNWLRVRYEAIASIPPNGEMHTAKLAGSDTAKMAECIPPNWRDLYIQESKKKEDKRGEGRKRASRRCPDDFELTDDMRAWAARECPGVNVLKATAAFKDHEFATPRSDWVATWRNWMRREKPDTRPTRYEELMEQVRASPVTEITNPLLVAHNPFAVKP